MRKELKVEEIIEACKEIKLERLIKKFKKKMEPIKNLLDEEEISQKEVLERMCKEELERFSAELEARLKAKKKEESKKEETNKNKDPIGEELIVSIINEHHYLFMEMEKEIAKERGKIYASIHPLIAKLKGLTLMKMLDISSCTRLAEWIMENRELAKKLGFKSLPETKSGIAAIFYQLHVPNWIISGKMKEAVEEIRKEFGGSEEEKNSEKEDSKSLKSNSSVNLVEDSDQEEKPKCPNCKNSTNVIRDGKRKTKTGKKQRWICKKCKKKFIRENEKTRYSEKIIEKAIMLHRKESKSSREIAEILKKEDGIEITHQTIARWARDRKKKKDKEKLKEKENVLGKDEIMKNYAWSLYSINGRKDYKEIVSDMNKQFKTNLGIKEVSRWIKERIAKRNGLICGQMGCFDGFQNNPDKKTVVVHCNTINKTRGKDEYICDTKLKELIEKNDIRLSGKKHEESKNG